MEKYDLISVIVPLLNEEKHVDTLMDALASQDYPCVEFLLTDGGSTDQTVAIIQKRQVLDSRFKLVYNPMKFVSHGFNLAIKQAQGEYIAFLGAHAKYPDHYLSEGWRVLKAGLADAAGGPLKQEGLTFVGKAIAVAMSSGFGVGNTAFRTSSGQQYVESVAFALYKKSVFEKIGGMDEDLLRNQDDEFHYRMNANGMRILMIPSMQAIYFVRSSYSKLFSQYFQYGLFKPLVLRKVHSGARIRHFVPALLVAYLFIAFLSFFIIPSFLYLIISPLLLYLSLAALFAIRLSDKAGFGAILISFFVLHTSYGLGFIMGLFRLKNEPQLKKF
jgi:GT2 family glycosyltransferase